jgi:hypothetical protein
MFQDVNDIQTKLEITDKNDYEFSMILNDVDFKGVIKYSVESSCDNPHFHTVEMKFYVPKENLSINKNKTL